jgi:hypothetical protein
LRLDETVADVAAYDNSLCAMERREQPIASRCDIAFKSSSIALDTSAEVSLTLFGGST